MVEYAIQSIVHGTVAALVVEALLRVWRIEDPDLRVRFRLLPLAFPLAVVPAFLLLAPSRGEPAFAGRALFSSARWGDLQLAGLPLDRLGLLVAASAGTGLLLFDLLPLVTEWRRGRGATGGADAEVPPEVGGDVAVLAGRLGMAVPRLCVLGTSAPMLLVRGIRRPAVVVSRGTLTMLDDSERRAALAHELAHVGHRDPLLGWLLTACRLVGFFNPAVQLGVRAALREVEDRADRLAARITDDPLTVASALLRTFRAAESRGAGGGPLHALVGGVLARGRVGAIEARCRRLLAVPAPRAPSLGLLRLSLTGVAVGALLFFVV